MLTLNFAETHNPVTFFNKPAESEGFEQIVGFLNVHPIRYALIVNTTIYVSHIKQFWTTPKSKTINGEVQIHALVDDKKVIVIESSVRRDLQLVDEDGIDCLLNPTIFENLKLMGYGKVSEKLTFYKSFFSHQWKFLIRTILQCLSSKTTAWNEFSSTIAFVIVCLTTNKVLNFSKLIFDGMIRNLDNVFGNFLMYPRSIQTFLDKQLDELPTHKEKYDAPFHTKKVFANIRRIGKDFSGRVTPLFPTMVTQTKATPNEPSSLGTSSGGGPRCQETIGDTSAHTRYERVSKMSNDSLLARVTKNTHKAEVVDLRKRVKNLEKKNMSRTHKLKRLYKVGLTARVQESSEITLVSTTHDDVDEHVDDTIVDNIVEDVIEEEVVEDIITAKLIVDVSTAGDQEVSAVNVPVSAAAPIITTAQPTEATKTFKITTAPKDKRKGKAIMIEEPEMPNKRKVQERLDKEYAKKLQAEIDEENRLEREKSQHKVEQLQLTNAEKAKLFMELMEKRRKFFAIKRVEEKRNKPPTKAQQRNIMCTYLKNMEGWKPKSLKNKSFADIQKLFDIDMKRVNTFVDYMTKLVVESSKNLK
ncbi:hypothetical protein Tco_0351943 [Tanacetum coccineum]